MRVPTIAWWPGKIPAGTACDAITGMFDILPTFVALAGGKLPADRKIDGADIWPLLAGQANAKPAQRPSTTTAASGLKRSVMAIGHDLRDDGEHLDPQS